MYAIGLNETLVLAKWRVLFLITGGLTSAIGVLFYFAMPDNPQEAWFLTPEERVAAAARLAEEHDGGDKTNFSMVQLMESMRDFNSYAAFLFGVLVTAPAPVLTVSEPAPDHVVPFGRVAYD
jgi:sugar phosphate permease